MKIWIFLLSILAATATWRWAAQRGQAPSAMPWPLKLRLLARCLAAGVAVYFGLLLLALALMALRAA